MVTAAKKATGTTPAKKKMSLKTMGDRDNRIRQLAYLKWLNTTGGTVQGDDPEGKRFWLEAEREIDGE